MTTTAGSPGHPGDAVGEFGELFSPPLGRGTMGLGGDSDKAIRDYARRTHEAWKRSKLRQAREKAFEMQRLIALVENESKMRKEERERAQEKKELLVEKMVASRKEQERQLKLELDRTMEERVGEITRERIESRGRRERILCEKKEQKERNVQARKLLHAKQREAWAKEIEDTEAERKEQVDELRRRAAEGRQKKLEAVERAKKLKIERAQKDKQLQRAKETKRDKRVEKFKADISDDIRQDNEVIKKRRRQREEERLDDLEKDRLRRRKEAQEVTALIKTRRQHTLDLIRRNHNEQHEHRLQLRTLRQQQSPGLFSPSPVTYSRPASAPAAPRPPVKPASPPAIEA
eukprot:TRINITY_DN11681_c1_g4_i1.p1 TRINITY_DN11681_c1_g4~~TRINITY_DN11681_c1_g4_i1.p1  ORF type:complete len:347 (+),score=142.69 TRINITY_DN11681_c1_g4_i1:57-1097(+)